MIIDDIIINEYKTIDKSINSFFYFYFTIYNTKIIFKNFMVIIIFKNFIVIIDSFCYNSISAWKGFLMDKKLAKDIRRFSIISNTAFSIITTLFMGVGLGLLLDYLFDKKYWTPICSVLFTFIAIYNFIKVILHITKLDDKKTNNKTNVEKESDNKELIKEKPKNIK